MKTSSFRILAALFVIVVVAGCVSSAPAIKRSPLELAELAYAEGSIGYEFGMLAVQSARGARLVSDAQWSRVDQAQTLVRQYAPLVRSALNLWRATGVKPASFDEVSGKLAAAFAEVSAIRAEVSK